MLILTYVNQISDKMWVNKKDYQDSGPANTGSDHYSVDVFLRFDTSVEESTTTQSPTTLPPVSSIESIISSIEEDTDGAGYLVTIFAVFSTSILISLRSRNRKNK